MIVKYQSLVSSKFFAKYAGDIFLKSVDNRQSYQNELNVLLFGT